MRVILVNGSAHKKGCTYTALCEVEKTLNQHGVETEIFHIGSKAVAGCIGCGRCHETGQCFMNDIVNEFVEKAKHADGFVFGSPVYYASANGSLISFMDRAFYSGSSHLMGKPAAAVMSCRRGGATATFDQINKYFSISSMPVVSSQYWNMVHGNRPEEVMQDLEGLQTMRTLGNNMAWLLACIQLGKDHGLEFSMTEEPQRTNFIR